MGKTLNLAAALAKAICSPVREVLPLVRFPNPLAPGSDIRIHVSWGTRLVTTAKLDDNLHGWTTDCLDGFQKSFQVIFSFDLEPFLRVVSF